MLNIIRLNKLCFILLGIYLSLVGILLLITDKGDTVLLINQRHNAFLDVLFASITFLGDGRFLVPFLLFFLLLKNRFEGIILTVSAVSTFLVIQFLKNIPFAGSPRPSTYFPADVELHFVSGITIHGYNSFPSGHTGQAFALFLLLSFFAKNKNWTILYFTLAVLAAISRIYLAQHFLIDTYIGAIIASILSFFVYLYFTNHSDLATNKNLQKGFFF